MKQRPSHIALVLGGGSGERFGSKVPKQYKVLAGKPLIAHCLQTLNSSREVDDIFVVAKTGTVDEMKRILIDNGITKARAVMEGGATRKQSVRIALNYLAETNTPREALLLIQDGDRPNLTEDLIQRNYEVAEKKGAAVTAIPVSDSVFVSSKGERAERYLKRENIYAAQTPQTFRFELIYKAHKEAGRVKASDDASLVSRLGKKVFIVEGSEDNYKINTYPQGLAFSLMKEGRKG